MFDLLKPQGCRAILRLFLSVMYPLTVSSNYLLHHVPALSDEQDQSQIREDELPLLCVRVRPSIGVTKGRWRASARSGKAADQAKSYG